LLSSHARTRHLYTVHNTTLLNTKTIMKTKGTKQKIQEANSIKQVNSLEKKALSFELASPKTLRKIAKAIASKRKELK